MKTMKRKTVVTQRPVVTDPKMQASPVLDFAKGPVLAILSELFVKRASGTRFLLKLMKIDLYFSKILCLNELYGVRRAIRESFSGKFQGQSLSFEVKTTF